MQRLQHVRKAVSSERRCGGDYWENDCGRCDCNGYAGLFLYDERLDENIDRPYLCPLYGDTG